MNAKLRKIDETSDVLYSLWRAGRISEPRYLAALKRLTDRAEAILAAMAN